tara:strand:+ start:410 stop:730 length:321 start_codon:yes stop_codon:yes gene_type:complete
MIFAKVKDGIVVECIVADQDFINNFIDNTPGTWLETREDGSIRKNYAGIGYTYDAQNDAFIAPKPFNSWVLNNKTFEWEAPVAIPDDEKHYTWNEETKSWDKRSGE